jgi:signal transduction histidine kinase/ActR/RegA family two-component response regulator
MTPDEVAIADAAFERIAGGHYPIELEFQLVTRSGTRRLISWTLTALADSDGAVTFIIGTGIDITERNRAERALRKAHDELEVRVRDRTAELATANEALEAEVAERRRAEQERIDLLYREKEARQQAEAANRAKDEFLATVSHELRTPLNAILGWAAIARRHDIPPSLQKAMETIERNARSQARIIDDMLDVGRIISGRLRLELAPVSVADAIDGAVQTVRPAAEAKQVTLQVTVSENAGVIAADAERLQQIVWNVLSNAVKFTPQGGRIELAAGHADGNVFIRIRDDGQGIPPDFLPHLFEPFRQADGSTTRRHGGVGLGLAIVDRLARAHGGRVVAESEGEGKGACFTIELPGRSADSAALTRTTCADDAGEGSFPNVPSEMRLDDLAVLVVDDEEDACELFARLLEDRGAVVTKTTSPGEALVRLREGPLPDVIVSDIGMPDVDGYTLIETIRSSPAGRRIPAVALTAYARPEDNERALAAGFQAHLSKPVDPMRLVSVIASLAVSSR